jgi:5-methylcytosine-specific restriction endonuclease McrA
MGRLRGPFHCERCGIEYSTRRQAGEGERYCSRTCADQRRAIPRLVRLEVAALREIASRWRAAAAIAKKNRDRDDARRLRAMRACVSCGSSFTIKTYPAVRCFACRKANRKTQPGYRINRKAHAARYRARRRGAVQVERVVALHVFERDGWRCYLCGIATPQELKGQNHHHAPTLDHMVALANGGSHTMENVKCACRACNSRKSDRTLEAAA